MYENDPNKLGHPMSRPVEAGGTGATFGAIILGALFIILLAFAFLPSEENRTMVSENTTRTERPATPVPTTPPAAKPQTDLKPQTPPAPTTPQ